MGVFLRVRHRPVVRDELAARYGPLIGCGIGHRPVRAASALLRLSSPAAPARPPSVPPDRVTGRSMPLSGRGMQAIRLTCCMRA